MLLFFAVACALTDRSPAKDTRAGADTDPTGADTDPTGTDSADPDFADTDGDTATDTAPESDTADVTIAVGTLGLGLRYLPDDDGRDELLVARQALYFRECLAADDGLPPPSTCMDCSDEDALYVLRGQPGAAFDLLTDADRVLEGDGCVGSAIAFADLDGDGVDEIVSGAPYSSRGGYSPWKGQNAGQVDLYASAPPTDAPAHEVAIGGWIGESEHGIAAGLVALSDLDGDGRDELATTMRRQGESGFLLLSGDTWSGAYPLGVDQPIAMGSATELTAGDLDGDGLSDLVFLSGAGGLGISVGTDPIPDAAEAG